MSQATAEPTSLRVRTRHTFSDLERALEAARGQFPTDAELCIAGIPAQTLPMTDADTIKTIARLQQFGKYSEDKVTLWLRGEQRASA